MSAVPALRELRALEVFDIVPAGHFALPIRQDDWAPHLRPGELAVIDTTDTVPQLGELFALLISDGRGDHVTHIVQPYRSRLCPAEAGTMYRFAGPGSHDFVTADGPLSAEGWVGKCRGRVVGVMVPG